MTWDQVQLFAEKASDRVGQEIIRGINTEAMAIGVAISGETEPVRKLAAALDLPYEAQPVARAESSDKLTQQFRDLASTGQVRVVGRGAEGRRARGRTGRSDNPVPIRPPRG